MLRNLTVRSKLIVLGIIFLVAFLVIIIIARNQFSEMSDSITYLYETRLKSSTEIANFRVNNRRIEQLVLSAYIDTDKALIDEQRKNILEMLSGSEDILKKIEAMKLTPEEVATLANLRKQFEEYKKAIEKMSEQLTDTLTTDQLIEYKNQVFRFRDSMSSNTQKLMDLNIKISAEVNESNKKTSEFANMLLLSIGSLAIIVSTILFLYISNIIVRPLKKMQGAMQLAANGDLTTIVQYQSKDEIGQLAASYNEMMNQLCILINQISDSSEQLAAFSEELTSSAEQTSDASEHIATAIQEVATGSDEQAQAVRKTSNTLQNMSEGIQQIAANAEIVSKTSLQASEKSVAGNEVIENVVKQMRTISNSINDLSVVVTGLGQRSAEIGQIVEVITGIAAQTNLLALNAAIEAARAGDQGKGFAVVADEVRKLAEQSGESAQKISELITNIQQETTKAVQSMQFATSEVTSGISLVNTAGTSFGQIQLAVNEVASQIQEVYSSVREMASGADQMLHSVNHIRLLAQQSSEGTQNVSAATEQQLASLQEISASSNALAKMAEELQGRVQTFKV
ncbi:methyl-accepting chemotaxis protein [Brevibacillus porteri]|uniref:methyl-accepting chemotaxis protein n=1 Tax=Brevibacillus porteri TaxID=2126350 RepID=UPI003639CB02